MATRAGLLLAFAGLGGSAAGLPASLPALAEALRVPVADVLAAVPLLFGGLFFGVLSTPLLSRRLTLAQLVALGAGLQAVGLALAATADTPGAFLRASALIGVGFGVVESGGAAMARTTAAHNPARLLLALTACVAGVAALTPLLVVVLAPGDADRAIYAVLAIPHVAAAVVLIATARHGAVEDLHAARAPRGRHDVRPVMWPATALFLYVGAESILAGWSAEYVRAELALTASTAALGTSAFWLLLTLGRVIGWALVRHGRTAHELRKGSLTTAGALLVTAAATSSSAPSFAVLATGVAIVACGPCYAELVSWGMMGTPAPDAPATSAALVASGALGGAVLAAATVLVTTAFAVSPLLPAAVAASLAAVASSRAEPSAAGRSPLP